MTFTQFLHNPDRTDTKPSFAQLARHDPLWPANSDRLEDFEAFLLARLEDHGPEVIAELRDLWREYAGEVPEAKHDLDLALAAWGDYARHLQHCSGTSLDPCEVAEQLLQRALDESRFDDLDDLEHLGAECEGTETEDELRAEDELESNDRGDWAGWDADDEEEDRADLN